MTVREGEKDDLQRKKTKVNLQTAFEYDCRNASTGMIVEAFYARDNLDAESHGNDTSHQNEKIDY